MVKKELDFLGHRFEGNIISGSNKGLFKCYTLPGYTYFGEFKDNQIAGFGKMIDAYSDVCTGIWDDGVIKDTCEYKYSSGNVYRGLYINRKRNGLGEYIFANGQIYRGMHIDGFMQEFGVYSWPNGMIYTGELLHNKYHGFGVMCYENGDQYMGEWFQGRQHGFGRYIFKNSKVNDNIWVNGLETTTFCDVKDVIVKVQNGMYI